MTAWEGVVPIMARETPPKRGTFFKLQAYERVGKSVTRHYCWFSHDVTKIQTKKLSILPRSYFYDALKQLKTNCQTNFRFKRVLGFVIECA